MPDTHSYRITYVGHATLLIEMDGVRILTDPVLRPRIYHLRRRSIPIPENLHRDVDAVLISHMHHDHLDIPSLRKLGHGKRLIVPKGAGDLLRKHGFQQVEEVQVEDRVQVGPISVQATFALHSGARGPWGPSADTLGFAVGDPDNGGHPCVYFAGDTDLFPEMERWNGRFDMALLPVWGWGPTLGAGHMDPYRAAQAAQLLAPRRSIPIHWGTLYPLAMHRVSPGFLVNPPLLYQQFMLRLAPSVDVHILQPGQHFEAAAGAP